MAGLGAQEGSPYEWGEGPGLIHRAVLPPPPTAGQPGVDVGVGGPVRVREGEGKAGRCQGEVTVLEVKPLGLGWGG